MCYVVTLKDNSYNKISFQFGTWELASAFIDKALICGNCVTANVELVLYDSEEEMEEKE